MLRLHPVPLVLLALLLPTGALAQATAFATAEVVVSGTEDGKVNLAECEADDPFLVSWSLTGTPTANQVVRVFADTSSGCSNTSADSTLFEGAAATGTHTAEVFPRADLLSDECTVEEDRERFVCFELSGDSLGPFTAAITVEIDTSAPTPPDEVSATGGDAALEVTWSWSNSGDKDSDIDAFRAAYRLASDTGDPKRTDTTSIGASEIRVRGLTNGSEYEVWVEVRDDFGNWSEASPSALATPQSSDDFWQHYKKSGGGNAGCTTTDGGPGMWTFLLLLGLPLLARRRVALLLGTLTVLGAAGIPASASAQGWVDPDRRWYFEFDLGPYRPEVDGELDGATPYQDVFGNDIEILGFVRLERALWQGFGQVGIGLGVGFSQAVGKGLFLDGTASPDTTVFNWLPFELTATYRFDHAALEWDVPLVPFGRVGLIYDVWWILDGGGSVAVGDDGSKAQGGRFGYSYSAGLQLLLDFIDPRLAKDFQRSSGVDNSYLFFEYKRMQIDGFGSPGFDLSDTTWFGGLAIEF